MESNILLYVVTICSFLVACIPLIVNFILRLFYRETVSEQRLRQQIVDLKYDQLVVNMVDEFAKYAKIQRKIAKVANELKTENSIRMKDRLKVKISATIFLYFISAVLFMFLVLQYGRQPIIRIDPDWLYPLDRLVVTKSGDQVGICLSFWLLLSNTVGKIVYQCI